MKEIRSGRLLRLAAYLDKIPPRKFDFSSVWRPTECGSVGCAIGYTPKVFPNLIKRKRCDTYQNRIYYHICIDNEVIDFVTAGMKLFNLSSSESECLFSSFQTVMPWNTKIVTEDATPKEVAESIRNFVKWRRNNPEWMRY